jgi:hypothetical protein
VLVYPEILGGRIILPQVLSTASVLCAALADEAAGALDTVLGMFEESLEEAAGALDTVLGMFEESLEEAAGALDTIADMATDAWYLVFWGWLEVSGYKKISPANKLVSSFAIQF